MVILCKKAKSFFGESKDFLAADFRLEDRDRNSFEDETSSGKVGFFKVPKASAVSMLRRSV